MEGRDGSPCFFVVLSCAAVGHEIFGSIVLKGTKKDFHAQLSATRLACIPLSSSLQRLGYMKISAVQEYSEASGFVRDSFGMMVRIVMHEGSVGGIGRRKAEARIVPLSACRTSRYASNKAKKYGSSDISSDATVMLCI